MTADGPYTLARSDLAVRLLREAHAHRHGATCHDHTAGAALSHRDSCIADTEATLNALRGVLHAAGFTDGELLAWENETVRAHGIDTWGGTRLFALRPEDRVSRYVLAGVVRDRQFVPLDEWTSVATADAPPGAGDCQYVYFREEF